MRLDKFLKNSRIIKRRTIANQACEKGRVKINGNIAKPATQLKEGDVIEIQFGENTAKYKVLQLSDHVKKEDAPKMYNQI